MKRVTIVCVILASCISMVIFPATPVLNVPAAAQSLEPPQVSQLEIPPGTLRTMDDMLADQATGFLPVAPEGGIPFRPGMDPAQYAAAKASAAAAAAAPDSQRPVVPTAPGPAAVVGPFNCDGVDEFSATNLGGGAFFPPDPDGAVGVSQYVQTTNVHVTVWEKAVFAGGCPNPFFNPLLDVDLNSFMGYLPPGFPSATQLFDARVVHDDTYGRWVVSAEGFPEGGGGTPQFHFIAVSQGEDATGPYFIFAFNTRGLTCSTCFWDFPQVGMDDGAVILTANIFNPGFIGSRWFFLNKQRLYYGLELTGCFFFGGVANNPSWAPPKVMDLNNVTWMLEAPPISNSVVLTQLTATDRICPILLSVNSVFVGAYTLPPDAQQSGTPILLDTLDARFQNRSTQVGDPFFGQITSIWNVHTINLPPLGATPRYYRIRLSGAGAPALEEEFGFKVSINPNSSDFNPSVAANFAKTVVFNWSSTRGPQGINAQIWTLAHATGGPFNFALVFTSSVPLTGNGSPVARWGDYSSIAIDPTNQGIAWGVNEEINNPDDPTGGSWGTRIFNVSIP